MDKAVFILGPTGTGKSDMAIKLAKVFNGEIISSDSVQIYKGFDIGSAKITKEEMQGVVHHAIDIVEPQEYFSVYDFVKFTREKIAEINKRGKLAIVVGGTGLYIKALCEGYDFGQADKNDEFRNKMAEISRQKGKLSLWQMLEQKNKELAQKIDFNNEKRVIRALELCEFGQKQDKNKCDFDYILLALTLDRQALYEKINKRVDIMIKNGLLQEVQGLLNKHISLDCQPMQAIGYKEIASYLQGKIDKARAIELVKQHSRNYAKRQETFLRGMSNVVYIDVADKNKAFEKIKELTENFLGGNNES